MGIIIPLVSVSAFWAIIGFGAPWVVPKGPNRGIIQLMIVMTAVCCWMFWIMVYLHQLNPLIGPQINVKTIRWISEKWGDAQNLIDKYIKSAVILDRRTEKTDRRTAKKIPERNHLDFIAGWGAGCIETCILYPSNKVIFRQQLHGYHVKEAIKQIKHEGFRRLYRGLMPPLIMRTTSRALMYGLYDEFQISLNCPRASQSTSFTLCHAQAAFLSGVCEATLCPLERVQVLLQAAQFHDRYKNTVEVFSRLKKYGYREYYRGFSVILVRNSFSNTLFFTLREPLKDKVLKLPEMKRLPQSVQHLVGDFVAGSLLGATISTLFFPLGVVKNHMQAKVGVPYENAFHVFRDVWIERNRSLRGLYLGVHLNFTRSLVAWGIINSMYGILRRALTTFE